MKKRTVGFLKRKLWMVFSRYIRARDAIKTTGDIEFVNCVTCGKRKETKLVDAGHYISSVKSATKFDERNVHAQCKECNMPPDPGMIHLYKPKIDQLYGEGMADNLWSLRDEQKKFKPKELEQMIEDYKVKLKELTDKYGSVWE